MGNFLRVIAPYRYQGAWVFDDPDVGLAREPFVFGADAMLDWLAETIPDADDGFLLYFAAAPFPGAQLKLLWMREEYEGNWYRLEEPPMEGWLCPALLKYFAEAPKEIYLRAEPKKATVQE
ncbi:MAG: hypothetical protein A2V70_13010 [Planctomycetes bacterium RBG_13_63_9]|nr:MAG: hypothetical protein A2V70_13010 [Planctomycetes bacterium RBG_13_63_9]